jgi:thioredoxin 1
MGKHTFEVTDANFQRDVLDSDVPVLVDFWADWCQPCKMIAPHVDAIAEQYAGKLKVAKLDVDSNPHAPGMYDIQGIPTLILFKGGAPVHRIIGFKTRERLEAELVRYLEIERA